MCMFICTFGAKYDNTKWSGKDERTPAIWKALSIPQTNQIAYIFEDVIRWIKEGLSYTGKHKQKKYGHIGWKPFIPMDSLEAQIIADWIEDCLSLLATLNASNLHQEYQGKELYTVSSICITVVTLKPKLLKVSRIIQVARMQTHLGIMLEKNGWHSC